MCVCVSLKSPGKSSWNQQHPIPADQVLTYVCSDTFYSHCLGNSTNQELLPKGVFGLHVNPTVFPKFTIECNLNMFAESFLQTVILYVHIAFSTPTHTHKTVPR